MVAGSYSISKLTHARNMGPQQLSRLPNTGTRIVDVDASWQWRSVEPLVDGLNQLCNVVPVFASHQFRGQQRDQVQ